MNISLLLTIKYFHIFKINMMIGNFIHVTTYTIKLASFHFFLFINIKYNLKINGYGDFKFYYYIKVQFKSPCIQRPD